MPASCRFLVLLAFAILGYVAPVHADLQPDDKQKVANAAPQPSTPAQTAAQVLPQLNEMPAIWQVAVDPATGNIAVVSNSPHVHNIIIYSPDGKELQRFRTIDGSQHIGWLPDSTLIVNSSYPNRNKPPTVYSQDGKILGHFGEKSDVLQMFGYKGKYAGIDNPGSFLADNKGNIYMTAPMADEDSIPVAEINPAPNQRFDHGMGARVLVYNAQRQVVRTIGNGWGIAPGQMEQPSLMSFNEDCSLIAVENRNGLDVFDVASGAFKTRIKGFQLIATAAAPFLVVQAAGDKVCQIDFEGKVIKTYLPMPMRDPVRQNYLQQGIGCALKDGTLFLPSGIGYTQFRKYSPDGKLMMCRGDNFDYLSVQIPKTILVRGQPVRVEIEEINGACYYAMTSTPQPTFRVWVKPLLGDVEWRPASLQPVPTEKASATGEDHTYLVDLPPDAVGPQALRVSLTDIVGDKTPQIQILIPSGAKGSVTLFTQQNRRNYQSGEEIMAHLVVQSIDAINQDIPVVLIDCQTGKTVVSGQVNVSTADPTKPCSIHLVLPASTTELLPPGDYVLTAKVEGLKSFPAQLSIVSSFRTSKAFMPLLHDWDFFMPGNNLVYPSLGDYSAWLGFNLFIQWRRDDHLVLSTQTLPSIANLLSEDIGYPAPEKAFNPNDWGNFLDQGVQTDLRFMYTIASWESFRVIRDEETLADDSQRVHVMTQSLGLYPNFTGIDYNITNFFVPGGPDVMNEFQAATNIELPPDQQINAYYRGNAKAQDLSEPLTAFFNFQTSFYARDYAAWRSALHDIKPDALGMGTLVSAQEQSWPPTLEPYLDITQSYMQCEQIPPIYNIMANGYWASFPWKPHVSDFENFNETGTGERMDSEVALSMLTGSWPGVTAAPVGGEGDVDKSANTLRGGPYVHREFFHRQALITDLLTTDRVRTPIGILITQSQAGPESKEMNFRGEASVWSRYYSACVLCQMAHRPARALFGEHLAAGKTFNGMKAILLVGQTKPLKPEEMAALTAFQAKGGIVTLDADCTVPVPGAKKLSVSTFALQGFGLGSTHKAFSTDGSWLTVPELLLATLPKFTAELDPILPATVYPDRPEIFMSTFDGGDATYLAMVNSRRPPISGLQYSKIAARFSSVMPLVSRVRVPADTKFVYDVLSRAWLPLDNGDVTVDLRSHANAVIACLPVKPLIKLSLPASVKSGDKLSCTLQATDEKDNPIKVAIPFIVDLRSDDGRLLGRRISCTANDGTASLEITAPAGISAIKASAVCAIGGETDTAQCNVEAGAQPQFAQETVLSANVSHLLESLKLAGSVILSAKGDAGLDQAITEHLAAAGITVQPATQVPIPTDKNRIVIVTGDDDFKLFGLNKNDIFPVTLSNNVPGANNAFLGLAISPNKPREDLLVADAPDKTGQERLLAALDNALKGEPASVPIPLAATMATVPTPEKPEIPNTAQDRFRADTLAERSLDPKAVWESRLKAATARIGSLTVSTDGKTLYAGALNWDSNLYALDPTTGNVRWTKHAGQGYVPHIWAGADGGVVAHILTTDDASHQAEVFDEKGTPLRRFAAPGVAVAPNGNYFVFSNLPFGWSLTVSPDGHTIIGAANIGVAAWDSGTGKTLWHKDTSQDITEVGAQPAERIAISPDGKKVAILYCTDTMYSNNRYTPCLEVCDLTSGQVIWNYQPEPFDQVMAITPVWSSDSSLILIGHDKGAWELKEGKVVLQFTAWPGSYRPGSQELFDGKTLLNAQGQAKWELDLAGRPISWVWSSDGDTVAVSTDLGELECHDKDGKLLWRSHMQGAAALTFRDGDLYAGDWSGMVYRYNIATGNEKWSADLGTARVTSAPLDDTAYSAPPDVPLVSYWPNLPDHFRPQGDNIATTDHKASIKLCGDHGWGMGGSVQINPLSLIGGAPVEATLPWQTPEETWTSLIDRVAPKAEITFEAAHEISGIVVHENPNHPEAFPRIVAVDARANGNWQRVWQGLVNPAAELDLPFEKPVAADGIRYIPIGCTLGGVYVQSVEVLANPNH